jgi:hypothetical protein
MTPHAARRAFLLIGQILSSGLAAAANLPRDVSDRRSEIERY